MRMYSRIMHLMQRWLT